MDRLDAQISAARGQGLLSQDSYRLISYGVAGLTGSLGIGFLLGTAVNPVFGFGFMGIGLMASAIGLLHTLRRREGRVLRALNPDTALIRLLVNAKKEPTIVTSFRGEVVGFNEAFRALDFDRARPIASLLTPDFGSMWVKATLARLHSISPIQETIPSAGGSEYLIHVERAGDYAVWSLRDQHQDQRLARYLASFDETVIAASRIMGTGIALIDLNGKCIFFNKIMRDWYQLGADDPIPSVIRLNSDETRLTIGTDSQMRVKITRAPIPVADGEQPLGEMLMLMPDIQPTFFADSEHIIDPLWDDAPIGVVVVSASGSVIERNRWFEQLDQNLIRKNIMWLFHRDDHSEVRRKLKNAAQGKEVMRPLDVRFQKKADEEYAAGQLFFASVVAGDKNYAVIYLLDLSQQKDIEEQFVQAQKMQAVGQLAGGVAHDFNNLLTAIIGFSDLLSQRLESSSQSFSDVTNIKQSANRAASLVRQMLAFSRQQTMRPTVLMIPDVLSNLTSLLKRLLGETVELDITYDRDIRPVKADQGQLEQVFMNLAVNARDAMEEDGSLKITVRNLTPEDNAFERYESVIPGDYTMIEVADTGEGIAEEHMSKIFDPFFTTKEVGKGTGLGLSTVYGIIKQTDGHILVTSVKGVGTTFSLFFKVHHGEDESALEDAEEKSISDLTGSATILLVEDEAAVRLFTARALINKGYEVIEASSGEEGLEKFNDNKDTIDLLVTDVIMSGLDGPGLVKAVKKRRADLPVIFISGYAEDIVRKDLEDESCHFLPKPFSLTDLAKMVKSVV